MKFKIILFWLFFSGQINAQISFSKTLADSAETLTKNQVYYNPAYFVIDYPNGDVPKEYGVCTDVVIRAYRKLEIDLQKEVHEDMKTNFSVYPKNWGLKTPDSNIDHRRVPNLMTFFERKGTVKPITKNDVDYIPGDIVCWRLEGGFTHIGLVTNVISPVSCRYMIVHNIGMGQELEDCLFNYKIIGHYSYQK